MEYGGGGYINPDDLYIKEPKFIKEKEEIAILPKQIAPMIQVGDFSTINGR